MRFWLISGALYLAFVAAALLSPVAAIWNRQGLTAGALLLYLLCAAAIASSAFMGSLMISKLVFPQFWWLGQVLGQDVFEYEGVYFLGLRLSRVPSRLQRLLFGADERFRWWDMLFGLMFLVLIVPHLLGAVTVYRHADQVLPRRILFPETLHAATLSALPVMREWRAPWATGSVLSARLERELETLDGKANKTDAEQFRLAQVMLLTSFRARTSVTEPYAFSPSDRVFFDRGRGAQAAAILRRFTGASSADALRYRVDALALLGFFYLADYNFDKARPQFAEALASSASGVPSALPRPLIVLLAAHVDALTGNTDTARRLLEKQVADETLPPPLQALTFEHLADVLRLEGSHGAAHQFLDKAIALYRKQNDMMGVARVYLDRGALYVDQGQLPAASQEISRASSQVTDADDLFTLNMVERIAHLLPAVG